MEALESQPKEGRDGICSEASGSDQLPPTPTQIQKTISCMSLDPTIIQQSTLGPALSPAPCDQSSENPVHAPPVPPPCPLSPQSPAYCLAKSRLVEWLEGWMDGLMDGWVPQPSDRAHSSHGMKSAVTLLGDQCFLSLHGIRTQATP